jgi:ribA/ribD-fused uncharacterized protein
MKRTEFKFGFSTLYHPEGDHVPLRQWINHRKEFHDLDTEFVFFWGGPYSQWAHSPFVWDGKEFPTAEHFMMYHKCLTFEDHARAEQVLKYPGPDQVKAIGRQIENYDDDTWAAVRFNVVTYGNILKFSQNPKFYDVLRRDYMEGDKILVEASPEDRVWGIGKHETDEGLDNIDNWNGQNLLGYAIMEAGERLKGF